MKERANSTEKSRGYTVAKNNYYYLNFMCNTKCQAMVPLGFKCHWRGCVDHRCLLGNNYWGKPNRSITHIPVDTVPYGSLPSWNNENPGTKFGAVLQSP